ncbi:hypothetical protein VNI00_013562 [Paramarasmius palmivorus]|uniref:Uncharacterized protein n=1 Tax=Paramarasmius palmivorus TaxID=297713 RepID=A0AAW0BXE5_9AGAR
MGQRHQAFLITRLIPHGEQTKAYYRCIAAVHHQWCYGRLPLSATRRFLNLVKNPENATIVRDEIRRAQGKYGCQGEEPKIPDMAFPYTQFLFVQAWNMDIDSPRGNTHRMGFEESVFRDPNVGVTTIQVDDFVFSVSAKISVDDPEGLRAVYQRFSSGPQGFTIIQSGTPDMLFNLQPTITSIPYFHPEKVLRGLAICLRPLEVGFDSSLRAKKYLASQLGPLMALSIATPLVPHPVIPSTFSSDSEDRLRWLHRSISTVPIKGSYDDFRAHGWLFVLKYTPGSFFSPIPHATYGFIKVDEKVHAPVLQELMEDAWKAWKAHKDSKAEGGTEAAKPNDNALPVLPVDLATLIKVYDVRGFADAVEKEGRPRPSEEAIAALEEVLDDEFVVEGLPPSKVFTQMDLEEAKTFIPIASQRIRFT